MRKPGKHRPGRPPTVEGETKQYPLNWRTTRERRKRLEESARRAGRNLIQEIEHRLDWSFSPTKPAIEAFYGPDTYNLMKTLAAAAEAISEKHGVHWLKDPDANHAAQVAAFHLLRAFAPKGTERGLIAVLETEGRETAARMLERAAKDLRRDDMTAEEHEERFVREAMPAIAEMVDQE